MLQNRQIIWIDDDIELLRPQVRNLTDYGYEIAIEPDVDVALRIVQSEMDHVGGVILDVMMNPGKILRERAHQGGLKTGLMLLEYLSESDTLRKIKIFILTHRHCPESQDAARRLGISYHQKQDFKGSQICSLVEREFGAPN